VRSAQATTTAGTNGLSATTSNPFRMLPKKLSAAQQYDAENLKRSHGPRDATQAQCGWPGVVIGQNTAGRHGIGNEAGALSRTFHAVLRS
jgi:hypothetical protein